MRTRHSARCTRTVASVRASGRGTESSPHGCRVTRLRWCVRRRRRWEHTRRSECRHGGSRGRCAARRCRCTLSHKGMTRTAERHIANLTASGILTPRARPLQRGKQRSSSATTATVCPPCACESESVQERASNGRNRVTHRSRAVAVQPCAVRE